MLSFEEYAAHVMNGLMRFWCGDEDTEFAHVALAGLMFFDDVEPEAYGDADEDPEMVALACLRRACIVHREREREGERRRHVMKTGGLKLGIKNS